MNKLNFGKATLIILGIASVIGAIILSIICAKCIIKSISDITTLWWELIPSFFIAVGAVILFILGIPMFFTGIAMKATNGSLKQNNLAIGTENMQKCPKCGNKVQEKDEYCGNCGNELSKSKVCPICNQVVDGNKKYCTKCGSEL